MLHACNALNQSDYQCTNMPRLDEHTEEILRDAEQGVRHKTTSAWDSFSNFALRDNVLEVAVGLMLANLSPDHESMDNTFSAY